MRKTLRRQRNYAQSPVSIAVTYDFDAQRWRHTSCVLLTPRESSIMAALASAKPTKQACIAACCSEKQFDNTVVILKRRFNVTERSQLTAIAIQLFS